MKYSPLVYDMLFSSHKFLVVQKQWTEMFPWNIGRALTLDVIAPGMAGNRNGALQLV